MKYMFSQLKLNSRKLQERLVLYKELTNFQTYRGFLLYVGINDLHLSELNQMCLNDNKDALKMFRILIQFKTELEVKMEEYLIYQGRHKDLEAHPTYNYKYLEFILKSSNPTLYSEKKILGTSKAKDNEIKLLDNLSEIKWNK